MAHELDLPNGHIRPEEFMPTFDSLINKLVDSMAIGHPSLFSPLAEFVAVTGTKYTPSENVQRVIKEQVESGITSAIMAQSNEQAGKFEPVWGVEKLCEWGIIANQLGGIQYDLEPSILDDPLMNAPANRDIGTVLNFELHHFNYDEDFLYDEKLLPLDIIYFAKLNGLVGALEGRMISELDERCQIPEFRQATSDEARQRLQDLRNELTEHREQGYKDLGSLEFGIEILENLLDEDSGKARGSSYWRNSDGEVLCYPTLTQEGIASQTPRQTHSTDQVREYLGPKLEAALKAYCDRKAYSQATEILYRRNRVKDFLGCDINIPEQLAEHDDVGFVTTDPKEIMGWVDKMVGRFGPNDLGSELVLPTSLNKKEYKLYRTIHKAMEYVRRGPLTYDTGDKRKLLVMSRQSALVSGSPLLLLPKSTDQK